MNLHELQLELVWQVDPRMAIEEAAQSLGLVVTQVATLAKYPGCIHWHFKRGSGRGTLEATYWPDQKRAWLSCRSGREADWIAPTIQRMKGIVEKRVNSG
jgi:hypothetical protein